MAVADDVERLGAAVELGHLGRSEAARELMRCGGFTQLGAEDVLDNWLTYRSRVADTFMAAEMDLAACLAEQMRDDE